MQLNHSYSRYFRRIIGWLAHCLVLVTPFIFTWVNEELFEFNKMLVVYGIVATMGVAHFAILVCEKKWWWPRTVFDMPIGLFLGSQVLSTLFSIHPRTSWFGYYTRFHGGLLSSLTYATLYWVISCHFSWPQLRQVLRTAVIGALGITLYTIPEHFGFSPSCWLISGGTALNASCWQQDVQARVFGTFGQPNWLAAYCVLMIPLALALGWPSIKKLLTHVHQQTLAKVARSTWLNVTFYVGTAFLLLVTLQFTGSRSGQLALAAAGGTACVLWLLSQWIKGYRRQAAGGAAVLFMTVGIVLFSPLGQRFNLNSLGCFLQPQSFFSELRSTIAPDVTTGENRLEYVGTDSGTIRCVVWNGALKIWQRYPLLGSGVETFAYSYYQDRPLEHNYVSEWDFLYNKAHNEFLNFLATTGLIGFMAYILLIGAPIGLILRSLGKNQLDMKVGLPISIGVSAGLVGLYVSNFFGFSTVVVTSLMWLSWAVINRQVSPLPSQVSRKGAPSLSTQVGHPAQYLALALLGIIWLWSLITIWTWWQADHEFAQGKNYLSSGYTLEGLTKLENAVQLMPHEALFTDELAISYAQIAVGLRDQGEATAAAEFTDSAQSFSDATMQLNPVHLNFYKSRARLFITLAELDSQYLTQSLQTLRTAQQLAPTDPKIRYNLGLILASQGLVDEAIVEFETAIAQKPNYVQAYEALAEAYLAQSNWPAAAAQYDFLLQRLIPEDAGITQRRAALDASLSSQTKP